MVKEKEGERRVWIHEETNASLTKTKSMNKNKHEQINEYVRELIMKDISILLK